MAKSCKLGLKTPTTVVVTGLSTLGGHMLGGKIRQMAVNEDGTQKINFNLPLVGAIVGAVGGVLISGPVSRKVSGCGR